MMEMRLYGVELLEDVQTVTLDHVRLPIVEAGMELAKLGKDSFNQQLKQNLHS